MNKKVLILAVYLVFSYSSAAYALDLGKIEPRSYLNQPFRAKIKLLSTNGVNILGLRVRVASAEVFRRVKIERSEYMDSVIFTPTFENGKPVILISSNKLMNHPFLNFLIEVNWLDRQLLKEYMVLLNPPILDQSTMAMTNNRAIKENIVLHRPIKKLAFSDKVISNRSQTEKYRVIKGDTLYKIAKKLHRKGVHTEQMAMAIFRMNPTAFKKRNMNKLKIGSLLHRPSKREARKLSYKQAKLAFYQ